MPPPRTKGASFTVKISNAELLFTETLINTLKSSGVGQIFGLQISLFVQSQFFMMSCNVWVTVDTEGPRMEASLTPWRPSPSEDVTGKDLKPFAAVLQSLHLDEPLTNNKIQRNYMALKITGCICSWSNFEWKIQKPHKKPNCPGKCEKKNGVLGAKAGYCSCPCSQHCLRERKTTQPLFQPDPWTYPSSHPI